MLKSMGSHIGRHDRVTELKVVVGCYKPYLTEYPNVLRSTETDEKNERWSTVGQLSEGDQEIIDLLLYSSQGCGKFISPVKSPALAGVQE